MTVIDRAKWERRLRRLDFYAKDVATEVMSEFCDEADGMAEFRLERCQDDDGEYIWLASIRWEGTLFDDEDEAAKGSRSSATEAVYFAIERFLKWSE